MISFSDTLGTIRTLQPQAMLAAPNEHLSPALIRKHLQPSLLHAPYKKLPPGYLIHSPDKSTGVPERNLFRRFNLTRKFTLITDQQPSDCNFSTALRRISARRDDRDMKPQFSPIPIMQLPMLQTACSPTWQVASGYCRPGHDVPALYRTARSSTSHVLPFHLPSANVKPKGLSRNSIFTASLRSAEGFANCFSKTWSKLRYKGVLGFISGISNWKDTIRLYPV